VCVSCYCCSIIRIWHLLLPNSLVSCGCWCRGGPEPEGPPLNSTILYLCNLTWWSTDAEVEALVTQYGELEQQVRQCLGDSRWGWC
jgi:hypothetical protein